MNRISVLMTVHNRREKTVGCLNRLLCCKLAGNKINIILVDDGSTDGTAEIVREKFPFVEIVIGNGNLYWNRGMRLAWEHATKFNPDYYLWLNDDTQLMQDSIIRILNCSKELSDQAIIVGSTYTSKDHKVLSYGGRLKNHNNPFVMPDSNRPLPCDTFNGNIVLIPRYVFENVGFNDDYYHHSFGDFDYGIVAGLKGIQRYVAPGYYGYCKRNNPIPRFRRKCYSLVERYKILYSPLGYNPKEDFHLNRKYRPLWQCIWYFVKLHINVLFAVDHTKYEE